MMDGDPFNSPASLLYLLGKRFNGILSRYWHVCRQLWAAIILGALLPYLGTWVYNAITQPGQIELPDVEHYAPAQLVLNTPWPITAAAVALISFSIFAAWQANSDQLYYRLLDLSAREYKDVRRKGYQGIAAQLRAGGQASETSAEPNLQTSDRDTIDHRIKVFDDDLYTERKVALEAFEAFVNQRKQRIFLLVGGGGAGKSTFLLHRMGEISGALPSHTRISRPHPSVFVSCKLSSITNQTPLNEIIRLGLGETRIDLTEIITTSVRGQHKRAFIIFVDAINENKTPPSEDINVHLTNFASKYLSGEYDIYLCASIRKTYWDEQRRRYAEDPTSPALGWLEYVYRPEYRPSARAGQVRGAETASVLLEEFEPQEFDAAYENYRRVYNIHGTITDERTRKICSNPLMLSTFCKTFHDQDISDLEMVRDLVRDLDIFNAYAKEGLKSVTYQVEGLQREEPIKLGETLPERAIRGLLLELALGMVDLGRQFLSDDEVLAIASEKAPEALIVNGIHIDNTQSLYDPHSVLRAILDEGIVLEQGIGATSERGIATGGIRFVTERYLEYSIGRGLVRRWRLSSLAREQIIDDFRQCMEQHSKLASQGFDNLRQGLGMAILVAEEPLTSAEARRGSTALPSNIHVDLLRVLAEDENFDWNQLACRVVQQTRTFNLPYPSNTPDHLGEVEELLKILDRLSRKNDFVLRWDIERALLHAVTVGEGRTVLRHLREWCAPSAPFSQRLFSAECLGYLFQQSSSSDYQAEVLTTLRQVIESSSDLDYWIIRSMMFSLGTMLDAVESKPILEEVYT